MRKKLLIILAVFFPALLAARETPVHCVLDAGKISEILDSLKGSEMELGDRMVYVAEAFTGSPEDDYYLTDSVGSLRINVDSFSPLMFVNNVIALAKASQTPGLADVSVFADEFQDVACRRGENNGYLSVMYHTSDWIGDNMARGNLMELTEDYNGVVARTKSLDEMTRRRSNYAALADSATFQAVRMTEMGFRTHRVPTLKKETIKKKEITDDLRNGDIIILVPNRDGIDMYDIGIVVMENGQPHLIHVSPQTHTVVHEPEDLARYMGVMTKHFQGYRILRAKD